MSNPPRRRFSSLAAALTAALALWAGALALPAPTLAAPGPAAAAVAAPAQAGFYRTHIGDVAVTVLSDGTVGLDVTHGLVLGAQPGELDRLLAQAAQASPIDASFNVFLIQLGSHTILVDTGAGVTMGATAGKLGQALANAGVRPADITDIVLTHVHPDHTGGLVVAGKRAFPAAKIHVDQRELDYWLDAKRAAKATGMQAVFFGAAHASLQPYLDAKQVVAFAGATELFPGLRSVPAYGHTPGHSMYVLESRGQKLTFWGDLVHIPAVQFEDPAVAVGFDVSPAGAIETREQALAAAADHDDLVAHDHVPFPGLGHIRRAGTGYRWVPVAYVNDAAASGAR